MSTIEQNRNESVQEMRRAMGTLPSERPELKTDLRDIKDININIISKPENPYRAIFESSVATWGNDEYAPKWERVSAENRFIVVTGALTGNTLPQALEVVSFLFQVRGTPRWLFEEQARDISEFTTYLSVGCRDNSKRDASMVLSKPLAPDYFLKAKDNYRQIIEEGQESWQSARAVLPMGYHHPYLFYTSLLSVMSNYNKFKDQAGREGLNTLLMACIKQIGTNYPLIERCILGNTKGLIESWDIQDPLDIDIFNKEA